MDPLVEDRLPAPWLFCPQCRGVLDGEGRCAGRACGFAGDPTHLSPRGPTPLADAVGTVPRILARPTFVATENDGGIVAVPFCGDGRSGPLGGVIGVDAASLEVRWVYDAGAAVEAAASVAPVRGTGARLVVGDAAGRVHGLRLDESGDLAEGRRSEPIDGRPDALDRTIEHAPFASADGVACVGTVAGATALVDLARCQVLARRLITRADGGRVRLAATPVLGPDGAMWWATYETSREQLREGSLVRTDPRTLAELGRAPLPAHAYAMPVFPRSGPQPVVALADGRVARLARGGAVELAAWQTDAGRMIRHSPAVTRVGEVYDAETLWIPTQDHRLVVMDLATLEPLWEVNVGRSLVATPLVIPRARLVVVSDNVGMLHAFDVDHPSAGPVWRHDLQPLTRTGSSTGGNPGLAAFDGLAFGLGQVYAAVSSGAIAAIPWHGGRLDWAAAQRESMGRLEEAAAFAIRATTRAGSGGAAQRPLPSALLPNAMSPRDLSNRLDDRAGVARPALLDHLGQFDSAAEAYERCGRWPQAMRLWRQIGKKFKVRRCFMEHCRAAGFPALEVLRDPGTYEVDLQVDADGRVMLRLRNNGGKAAEDVRVTLSIGTLRREEKVPWLGAGSETRVEFTHVVAQRAGRAELGVRVTHAASAVQLMTAGGHPDDLLWTFDVEVRPAPATPTVFSGPVIQTPGGVTMNYLPDGVQLNEYQGAGQTGEEVVAPPDDLDAEAHEEGQS